MNTRDLLKMSAQIHDHWHSLRANDIERQPPYYSANGYLKREVYRMVRRYLLKGTIDTLRSTVMRDLEQHNIAFKSSQTSQDNPFYWGLMSVLGLDDTVRRQERYKFANELLYAHRHDVPPEFLVGFIYQIGSSDMLKQRLLDGKMEQWYHPPK